MISFACRDIEFSDLLSCSFELNKTEYNVLTYLLKSDDEYTASDLGSAMGLDRTTVQKALKMLAEKNLVFRQQKNLSKGGYTFYYRIKDKDHIKDRMLSIVRKWTDNVTEEISRW